MSTTRVSFLVSTPLRFSPDGLLIALAQLDLEGDWDPDAYDKQIAGIYGDDAPDINMNDAEKPTWDDDIDITDILPSSSTKSLGKKKVVSQPHTDVVDEDVAEELIDEEQYEDAETRKRKWDEHMKKVDEMDFNDMVRIVVTNGDFIVIDARFRLVVFLLDSNTQQSFLKHMVYLRGKFYLRPIKN